MPAPPNCPPALYEIMLECWHKDPMKRPTFETLQWKLEDFFTIEGSEYKEAAVAYWRTAWPATTTERHFSVAAFLKKILFVTDFRSVLRPHYSVPGFGPLYTVFFLVATPPFNADPVLYIFLRHDRWFFFFVGLLMSRTATRRIQPWNNTPLYCTRLVPSSSRRFFLPVHRLAHSLSSVLIVLFFLFVYLYSVPFHVFWRIARQ